MGPEVLDSASEVPELNGVRLRSCVLIPVVCLVVGCESPTGPSADGWASRTVAATPTRAQAADGRYISWREHVVDDEAVGGVPLRGGDGLAVADLDRDGHPDVVSVHEADTTYDGVARGYVRVAFGSDDPDRWHRVTLADGEEAGGAADVALDDLNGDGYPDVLVACELAHVIYLQNPGREARTTRWERVIPSITRGRGSFIRVFAADLDGDGRPEVVAVNKGAQSPEFEDARPTPISWFDLPPDPLEGDRWVEHVLTRVAVPINARPVDLDGDGDLDVFGGSMAEARIFWLENVAGPGGVIDPDGDGAPTFEERPIEVRGGSRAGAGDRSAALYPGGEPEGRFGATGFNVDLVDLSGDGRLDLLLTEGLFGRLVWLEQPGDPTAPWTLHPVGSIAPDQLVGLAAVDVDGDGDPDVMAGGYSRGPRDRDGEVTARDPLGRIAWFENPGDVAGDWERHDVSRRVRGMYDRFVARDLDGDGDTDFLTTRGNSGRYDGVLWLEQIRTSKAVAAFTAARPRDSAQMPLPDRDGR